MVDIPSEVQIILYNLNEAGHEAYIVGGCVRDALMGRIPNDWDITTSATPDIVKKVFPKTYDTGLKHGTVTVRMNDEGYEVTTYRVEGDYEDYRRPSQVEFVGDITLDLGRRDFTMNAMGYHPNEGFIDPYNGMADINQGIIRSVRDPEERFTEDALRILRGIRFAAQLGFNIQEETLSGMLECAHLLEHISQERIREEMMKILLSDRPDRLINMHEWDLLQYVIPELIDCFYTPQNHPHHVYDVARHTIKAIEQLPKDPILRLTMLLHDIGKPATHTRDENHIDHFYGHVPMSVKMSKKILKRLRFDNETIKKVTTLVEYHDFHIEKTLTRNSIKEVLCRIGEDLFEKLLLIQEADARAQNPDKLQPKLQVLENTRIVYKEILASGECYTIKGLAIDGKDIVAQGIKPGKQVGDSLQKALAYVIENPHSNNKQHLLEIITNIKDI